MGVREHQGLIAQSAGKYEVCKREKVNVPLQLHCRGGGAGVLQTLGVPTVKKEENWNGSSCWRTSLQPLRPQQLLLGHVRHTSLAKDEIVFYKDSIDLLVTISCLHHTEQVGSQERFTKAQVPGSFFHSRSEKELLKCVQVHGTPLRAIL